MVAIKDMKMPSCCHWDCPLCNEDGGECMLCSHDTKTDTYKERAKDCPLVEIEERKVGKWIDKSHTSGCGIKFIASECTCCGKKTLFNCNELFFNYCPNCGCRMESGE